MAHAEENWQSRAEIRLATWDDMDDILRIFDMGRDFMRSYGNYSQWMAEYPGRAEVTSDIEHSCGYVVTVDGVTEGYFMLTAGPDKNYLHIEDGAWLNDEPYGVGHRMAVSGKYRAMSDYCFDFFKTKFSELRVDTHADNPPMQRSFLRNGFVYCGTVFMDDGTPRRAYQYIAQH